MASGFLRRAMIQLGLVDDDEYDDYEVYEDAHPVPAGVGRSRQGVDPLDPPSSQVRPVPRDFEGGGVTLQPQRPAVVRPVPMQSTRVHVVAPSIFADAQEIGEHCKNRIPVIVNLKVADGPLSRRMIDFCSGVAYALSGKMERVADKVFLVTPSNVKVSAEERQRLQENGLLRP